MTSASPSVVIRGGRVVDRAGDERADVAIVDGRIAAVGADLEPGAGDLVLDAAGCLVLPGLVDVHAHLRQPGKEEAETIETGARAAALGGFTCIVAMPNTTPAIDSAGVAREVLELGRATCCDVRTSAAITVGRAGTQLTPMAELAALGVRLFTDDGNGVQDVRLMRRAMEYARGLDVTLAEHCEDEALSAGGHMHEGSVSARLGIPGQPAEAEELMVMRDIALSRLTGAKVHFQHLSTQGSIAMVRAAKGGGLPVTCEATPHHFTLTDERCATFDPVFKVNPPLRTDADVAAVRAGLADGSVDCIATDHAPHAQEEKERPFDEAPPGMLGLQTALALALTYLQVSPSELVGLMASRPAAIVGVDDVHGGPIAAGRPANLCVVDPAASWVVEPGALASRSRNTPYAGMKLTGQVRHTLLWGEPVVRDGEAQR
ncbi:MAG TPA: dihydroorotase [Acidimicrobiales bacterium]|nr:dihydroorotase [Acidimicrobiales bacterium]